MSIAAARAAFRDAARAFVADENDMHPAENGMHPGEPYRGGDLDRGLELAAVTFVAAMIRASDDNPDLSRGGSVASFLETLASEIA